MAFGEPNPLPLLITFLILAVCRLILLIFIVRDGHGLLIPLRFGLRDLYLGAPHHEVIETEALMVHLGDHVAVLIPVLFDLDRFMKIRIKFFIKRIYLNYVVLL